VRGSGASYDLPKSGDRAIALASGKGGILMEVFLLNYTKVKISFKFVMMMIGFFYLKESI